MKKMLYLFTFLILFTPSVVFGQEAGRTNDIVNMRTTPTVTNDNDAREHSIPSGVDVIVYDLVDENPIVAGCTTNKWYKILYDGTTGYVCSSFVNISDSVSANLPSVPSSSTVLDSTDTSGYNYLNEYSKFPSSYKNFISSINSTHPNWKIYAINTNIDWNEAVNGEKNSCYLQNTSSNDDSFFDTLEGTNYNWELAQFNQHEAGGWYTASKETVSYYFDPRNYMTLVSDNLGTNYRNFFAFEDSRAYSYQNNESINKMLQYAGAINKTVTRDGGEISYNQAFTEAANATKVSAMFLIARSRNETQSYKSNSVSGNYTNDETGINYSGYYNYYNIGAFGKYPVSNGLQYAIDAGWNSRYKAIVGGADFISSHYIYAGQETPYFQKFNVGPDAQYGKFGHQFQTNIQASSVEGIYVFWGYEDSGNIDNPIVFHVPYYNNSLTSLSVFPHRGNPNNWLTSIKINGNDIDGFNGDNYYSYDNNWDGTPDNIYDGNVYTYDVGYTTSKVNITATPVISGTTISGIGDIQLVEGKNIINVVSKALNDTTKTYRIIINKQETPKVGPDGKPIYPDLYSVLNGVSIKRNDNLGIMNGLNLGTTFGTLQTMIQRANSLVQVQYIKNSNNKTNYLATGDTIKVISGDNSKEYKYILSGDINGDGSIDLSDLVNCRNLILEQSNLGFISKQAADTNKNGSIDLGDLVSIRNDILGISAVSQ